MCVRALCDVVQQHGHRGMERDRVSKGPFVTCGDIGDGGDAATPQCLVHATGQSGAVRSPRTAHSFFAEPELFQSITAAGDLEARPQHLVTCGLPEVSLLQLPQRPDRGTH